MDIDQLKSEDHMEMMMMMQQQMDKIPEFCNSYDDANEFQPSDDFSGATNSNTTAIPHCLETLQSTSHSMVMINYPFNSPSHDHDHPRGPVPVVAQDFLSNNSKNMQRNSSMAAMREMIFRIAAMQPIHIDPESVKPPKRRNVRISKDPQSVAARHRRERISERIRILQRLVPGGTKMDTASMLDEAIHYVKFLKTQVQSLERASASRPAGSSNPGIGLPVAMSSGSSCYLPVAKATSINYHVRHYGDAYQ